MRYVSNATSPNIVGGYPGNNIGAFHRQTIAGGGETGHVNSVAGNGDVVWSGSGNTAEFHAT